MAPLDSLSAELVEQILLHLPETRDLLALRLVSRALRSKSSQECFKYSCRKKRVYVDESGLNLFVQATADTRLVSLIEDVTLIGMVYNCDGNSEIDDLHGYCAGRFELNLCEVRRFRNMVDKQLPKLKQQRDFLKCGHAGNLLVQAFRNIIRGKGPLRRVRLNVAVSKDNALEPSTPWEGGCWKLSWQSAADTARLLEYAVETTRLRVQSLDLFSAHDANGQQLSALYHDDIFRAVGNPGLNTCLSLLRSLVLSFSDVQVEVGLPSAYRAWNYGGQYTHMSAAREQMEQDVWLRYRNRGVETVLRACQNLESLDLHRIEMWDETDIVHDSFAGIVSGSKYLLRGISLPKLQDCKLRGFCANPQDMLYFLQRHALNKLMLQNFTAVFDTCGAIFEHCTNTEQAENAVQLGRLELENIVEVRRGGTFGTGDLWQKGLVLFSAEGGEVGGLLGNNALSRSGSGVPRPIHYTTQVYASDRRFLPPLSRSDDFKQWEENNRKTFGPPYRTELIGR